MKPNKPMRVVLVVLAALAFVPGCATSHRSASKDGDAAAQDNVSAQFDRLVAQAKAHWKERAHRADAEQAIELWQKAADIELAGLPDQARTQRHARVYEHLARAHFFVADAFLHDDVAGTGAAAKPSQASQAGVARPPKAQAKSAEQRMRAYRAGIDAAQKAIALRAPAAAAAVAEGDPWSKHLATLDKTAVPALYWYAANLANWGLLEGPATILARSNDIKAIMDFVCTKDERYDHAACHRFMGIFWATLPYAAAPAKSKARFDQAIKLAPDYLPNKLLEAKYYAPLAKDRGLYDDLLAQVVNAPKDDLPENQVARQQAHQLQQQAPTLFKQPTPPSQETP